MAYLAYILASMPQEEDRIRTIAGYLLKNNARSILRAASEVIAFTKAAVLQAFNDPATMIRNAAGQDIVAFLGILEPKNWPECLSQLVQTLDSSNLDQQEVSSVIHTRVWELEWPMDLRGWEGSREVLGRGRWSRQLRGRRATVWTR